jgi:tRNA(Ile)-lysidine synthase TilS/MesJ
MTEVPKDPAIEAERLAKLAYIEKEMKKQAKRELRSLKDQYLEMLRKDPHMGFVHAK